LIRNWEDAVIADSGMENQALKLLISAVTAR
jgi:hypothetical protein